LNDYLRTVFDKFELRVRKGYYYTKDDLWVSHENGKVRVGVSDYLQKTSGDVAFVELAKLGSTVQLGDELGTIESAKTTVTLLSPISGKVDEINGRLAEKAELVNSDSYGDGWLVIIAASNLEELKLLFSADDYHNLMLNKLQGKQGKLESK
jgi:glycine cleavage system H protein